jgi:hypothetical protein
LILVGYSAGNGNGNRDTKQQVEQAGAANGVAARTAPGIRPMLRTLKDDSDGGPVVRNHDRSAHAQGKREQELHADLPCHR